MTAAEPVAVLTLAVLATDGYYRATNARIPAAALERLTDAEVIEHYVKPMLAAVRRG